ncbi:MAG: hypothetical protein NTX76_06050 [Alphaproteobacteria bacterium]|nr:hypothetical protein [Alphaproteobacteria bacterium]
MHKIQIIPWLQNKCLFWKKFLSFLSRDLPRVTPSSYLVLWIHGKDLTIITMVNGQATAEKIFSLGDKKSSTIHTYLQSFPSTPIYILLEIAETNFRLLSLQKARFWDKHALLKQASLNMFSATQMPTNLDSSTTCPSLWTQKDRFPSSTNSLRYWIAGIPPSEPLRNFIDFLSTTAHSIIDVQLWPMVVARRSALVAIRENIANRWVLIVLFGSRNTWQIIVCDDTAPIIYRQGTIRDVQSAENLLLKLSRGSQSLKLPPSSEPDLPN